MFDRILKALTTVSARDISKELKNKFEKSRKKLLTKQTTCDSINELLLNGNKTQTAQEKPACKKTYSLYAVAK